MNYHIITQDKFFYTYIEDIYRLREESNNIIWVRGVKENNAFFHTERPVEYLGNDPKYYRQKLKLLKPGDKLFVSWYDSFIGTLILESGIQNLVYVYLMGAEFYSSPYWVHAKWLFDPLTKWKVYKTQLLPRFFPKGKPWLWYKCKNWWKFKRDTRSEYLAKLETIKRIDYIVITEHSGPEIELVKQLYPGCTARHVVGSFDQNYDLAKQLPIIPVPEKERAIKILFGNSSDPSGNQLDGFRYIKSRLKGPYEIYSFLSYGDLQCRNWTIEYGRKLFKQSFFPITDYMDRTTFVGFVQQMDVVMMFHNRQQAEGNIMTALALGKPVFMKPENPQYDMLKRMGVKSVYDVHKMHQIDLLNAIVDAQKNRDATMRAIELEYSEASRLNHLRNLLSKDCQ
jgi:hypothetical protein